MERCRKMVQVWNQKTVCLGVVGDRKEVVTLLVLAQRRVAETEIVTSKGNSIETELNSHHINVTTSVLPSPVRSPFPFPLPVHHLFRLRGARITDIKYTAVLWATLSHSPNAAVDKLLNVFQFPQCI